MKHRPSRFANRQAGRAPEGAACGCFRLTTLIALALIFSLNVLVARGQAPVDEHSDPTRIGPSQAGQSQTPPFGPAQQPGPINRPPSPGEYQAFTSALSQTPASAQAAALQSFLEMYPDGPLAAHARRLLALNASLGAAPHPGVPLNPPQPRPMTPRKPDPLSASKASVISVPGAPGSTGQTGQQPIHRAVIDLAPHTLTIRADNSSLVQIFRDLSASTGLKVEGLTRDQRIYGSFGPGDPHDVITALVNGLGYNFMMLGESSHGVPRQLILTVQAAPQAAAGTQPTPAPAEMEQEEEVVQDDQAQPEVQDPGRSFMPPQIPAGQGPGANRTTQQMLDELRQMHPQPDPQPPQP